jgi:glutamate-ammonia-ligase adenylyltransferase
VLSPDFLEPLPDAEALEPQLDLALREGRDFQDVLELSRRWANDRKFQVGVHLLDRISEADDCAIALTAIAETTMNGLFPAVLAEIEAVHGTLPGDGMAVIALGKLGSREMTVTSDLDLVFLYDAPAESVLSDGAKPLPPSVYYARLAQRFINALSAPTGEGRLYEIDMRLRPSGNAGPIATTLPGFTKYQRDQAWTWEHMALTRARAIIGTPDFTGRVQAAISDLLTDERDPETLVRDIAEMRARVAREHRAGGLWDVKQRPGGLIDLEFLVQYWQLRHGHLHPETLDPSTATALRKLAAAGVLKPDRAEALDQAARLLRHLQAILRLTVGQAFDEDQAPEGLKVRLAAAGNCADFAALKDRLDAATSNVQRVFREVIEDPGGRVNRDEPAGKA